MGDMADYYKDHNEPSVAGQIHDMLTALHNPPCKHCGQKLPMINLPTTPEAVAVDTKIADYLLKNNDGGQTYTDLYDSALRQVLYDQERRLQLVERTMKAMGVKMVTEL